MLNQLILHLWGDYILQSTWMALNKSKRAWPCFIHCVTYTVPFVILTQSITALLVIFATHYLIDRYGLARYLIWLKEGQRPEGLLPWEWCSMTGYFDMEKALEHVNEMRQRESLSHWMDWYTRLVDDPNINRPVWIRVWLTIVADNTLHLTLNAIAIALMTPRFDHWLLESLRHALK